MAIDLSQFITAKGTGAISSLNVLFSSAVSSGSLIVLHFGYFTSGGQFSAGIDNVNANNYTVGCFSTMSNASDTASHAGILYKVNISSGAAASTYRVSLNMTASIVTGGLSIGAMQYTGGPWTAGSTKSANGTSSSPAPGATTGSSTPLLFVANASVNSTAQFNVTINTGTLRQVVDTANTAQILAIADSTNSSLTQNPTFGITTSTRWLSNSVVFVGLSAGGPAAVIQAWQMAMGGVQ